MRPNVLTNKAYLKSIEVQIVLSSNDALHVFTSKTPESMMSETINITWFKLQTTLTLRGQHISPASLRHNTQASIAVFQTMTVNPLLSRWFNPVNIT